MRYMNLSGIACRTLGTLVSSAVLSLFVLVGTAGAGSHDVLTSRGDDGRTGAALSETVLTPEIVDVHKSPGQFGKLFAYHLDFDGQAAGDIYAQPLYVSNV